jgi:hypothetical protein
VKNVRRLAILLGLCLGASIAQAQEQERKLVDRLLSPDTSLANPAQTKKFTADRKSTDKQANVGTFYIQKKSSPKSFSTTTRNFRAGQFHSRSFPGGQHSANDSSRTEIVNARSSVSTLSARGVRETSDARKVVDSHDYSGERQFLDRGKSQKSLERHNPPMTIDEVRELLNKNK